MKNMIEYQLADDYIKNQDLQYFGPCKVKVAPHQKILLGPQEEIDSGGWIWVGDNGVLNITHLGENTFLIKFKRGT